MARPGTCQGKHMREVPVFSFLRLKLILNLFPIITQKSHHRNICAGDPLHDKELEQSFVSQMKYLGVPDGEK